MPPSQSAVPRVPRRSRRRVRCPGRATTPRSPWPRSAWPSPLSAASSRRSLPSAASAPPPQRPEPGDRPEAQPPGASTPGGLAPRRGPALLHLRLRPAIVGLARGAALDLVEEQHVLRKLVAGDVLAGVAHDLVGGGRRQGRQLDQRHDLLPPALAGPAHHHDVVDGRMPGDRTLDLLGEVLLSPGVVGTRVPPEQLVVAFA